MFQKTEVLKQQSIYILPLGLKGVFGILSEKDNLMPKTG